MSSTIPYLDYYSYESYDNYNYTYFFSLCENNEAIYFGEIFTQVLYSLIFIFTLIGNILVLWILMRYEKLKTTTDIFILNLITSDLLFACSLPIWAVDHTHGWIFGKAMCKIMSSIFFVSYYSGILLLTLVTVDRYFVVVCPLTAVRTRKLSYGVVACLVVWCISILATVPEMIFSDVVHWNESFSCESIYPKGNEQIWQLVQCYQQNLLFFLIPFVVIVYCYYRILNTVVKCRARKKFKAVKIIFCIVAVFFVCWAPYNVVIFLLSLYDLNTLTVVSCEFSNHLYFAYYICRDIAYFHCCLNPFFYALVGTKFRKHLKRTISTYLPLKNINKQSKYSLRSRHLSNSHDYSNSSGFNTI
ncbi:chemokine XC receptor 1-like [Pristis pectinata]|uniref:chemokine XC receptor 1-like n=1 Tax=Pristis pectinata TaxID=685728 RepID=UPI00223DB01F|nr:chemokine XC receptor 1-like [Pristis pectinata]